MDAKLVGANIKAHRKSKRLTQSQLAPMVGLDTGNISRIENGLQSVPLERLEKFAAALDTDIRTLLDTDDAGALPDGSGVTTIPRQSRSVFRGQTPLLDASQLEGFAWERLPELAKESTPWPTTSTPLSRRSFAMTVTDDTMTSPDRNAHSFPEGTVVVITDERPASGDYVFVCLDPGTPLFRRLTIDADEHIIRPLNPTYRERTVRADEVKGVMREAQYLRSFRTGGMVTN